MAFVPFLQWVDVPDPKNPPVGAKQIEAGDLLRYELGITEAHDRIGQLEAAGPPIAEDSLNPGLYFLTLDGQISADPDNPGLFLIGA